MTNTTFSKNSQLMFISSTIDDGNMSPELDNRNKFFLKNNIDPQKVASVTQVHGNNILKIDRNNIQETQNIEADGMITNENGVFLLIKSADCHQLAFFDSTTEAIGLVHAGWQGLDKGILKNVIAAMYKEFKTNPKDLIVKFGPSIGPCCYKGLSGLKQKDDPKWQPYIFKENGFYGLDIWQFAEDQLLNLGIKKQNIDNPKICTYHTNTYFSHRKSNMENTEERRFITVIGIDKK